MLRRVFDWRISENWLYVQSSCKHLTEVHLDLSFIDISLN